MRTLLAALCCAFAFASHTVVAATESRPPNIIHIVADDVGYDDFGCYGAPRIKTPNIDKLASQGMRFTSFYAPAATCTPSRAAMMTGCYAERVGVNRVLFPNDNIGLNPSEVTIAELLKTRGYATACIGKWHLGHLPPHLPTKHGFDLFLGIPYPNDHGPERERLAQMKKEDIPPIPLIRNEQVIERPAKLAELPDRFTAEAIKFIGEHKDAPFFLHLANIETHTPWFLPDRAQGPLQEQAQRQRQREPRGSANEHREDAVDDGKRPHGAGDTCHGFSPRRGEQRRRRRPGW